MFNVRREKEERFELICWRFYSSFIFGILIGIIVVFLELRRKKKKNKREKISCHCGALNCFGSL